MRRCSARLMPGALAALAALCSAPHPVGAQAPSPRVEGTSEQQSAPGGTLPAFSFCRGDAVGDLVAFEAALSALAAAHPELVSVRDLGSSAGGRVVWSVEVAADDVRPVEPAAAPAGSSPDGTAQESLGKPTLLVVPELDGGDLGAASLVAGALCRLAERAAAEPEIARTLRQTAFFSVPCADPDAAAPSGAGALDADADAGAAARRAVRLARNFPQGWDAWREPGAGPYPLSRPEARALAQQLTRRVGLAVVLEVVTAGVDEVKQLRSTAGLGKIRRATAQPGSLAAFVQAQHGAFVFQVALAPEGGEAERSARVEDLASALLDLARRMPRAALEEHAVARLGEQLWQIDLLIANRGSLATHGAWEELARIDRDGPRRSGLERPGLLRPGQEHIRLVMPDTRMVGTAVRREPTGSYEVLAASGQEFDLGGLEGGETLELRLVVEALAGSQARILLGAPQAGWVSLELELE